MEVTRTKSVLLDDSTLETLYVFPNFPTYAGCVNEPAEQDKLLDLSIDICTKTGILQLKQLASMDDVYLYPHNDAIGVTWKEHNTSFLKFIEKFSTSNILEIGGGSGKLALEFLSTHNDSKWTIIDPNPLISESTKLHVIKEYFRSDLPIEHTYDTLIHSHVFEHQFNPEQFLTDLSLILKPGDLHIFSIPNMHVWLKRKYLNCLNFEHTIFLIDEYVNYLLKKTGFELLTIEHFREDHSIFYATRFTGKIVSDVLPNLYSENKQLYSDFIDYYKNFVSTLNSKLINFNHKVFLFGAHMFSQYLLAFGLDQSKILGILDNSELKIGKRLYGTNLKVFNPNEIRNIKDVGIIIKVGSYRNEIVEQLKKINPSVTIFE